LGQNSGAAAIGPVCWLSHALHSGLCLHQEQAEAEVAIKCATAGVADGSISSLSTISPKFIDLSACRRARATNMSASFASTGQ
jgi:hypothetical protein